MLKLQCIQYTDVFDTHCPCPAHQLLRHVHCSLLHQLQSSHFNCKVLARTQLLYISHLLTLYNTALASQKYELLFIVFMSLCSHSWLATICFINNLVFIWSNIKLSVWGFPVPLVMTYLSWWTTAWTISSLLFSFYFFVIFSSICCSSSILQTKLVSVSFLVYNIIHLCITSCYLTDRSIFRVQWFIVFDA